ncbi:MAG: alpha/beta fold hydrolase [Acidobacteriota bacterium]
MSRTTSAPPPRPGAVEEYFASRMFRWLAPPVPRRGLPDPPEGLAPWRHLSLERRRGGSLSATWYPPVGTFRGVVLMVPPWLEWGRSYFHRRGRIQALRGAGYSVLAMDLSGFGGSKRHHSLYDRDVEDGLRAVRQLVTQGPLHVWGVSSGGYWSHAALSRTHAASGAFFEDVSPHLIEWSERMVARGKPFYRFFRSALRRSYGFLDIRRHAPHLGVGAVAYVGGQRDRGIPPQDTQSLAEAADGEHLLVPQAGHLAAIKLANQEILDLALATFARAEKGKD